MSSPLSVLHATRVLSGDHTVSAARPTHRLSVSPVEISTRPREPLSVCGCVGDHRNSPLLITGIPHLLRLIPVVG